MNEHLSKLNKEQLEAVCQTEGPVLVLAGAGSGKTRVLTSRIAYILEKELCYPSQILAITFTNKAANEMRERVEQILGEQAKGMWISTIHSMCLRILRASIGRLEGYNKNFTVYSENDRERVIKRIISELNLEGDSILKNAKYHISFAKTADISPQRYLVEGLGNDIPLYCKIYKIYEETLKSSNAMDFDDLLLKTYHLLDEDEEVRNYYANKFHYVLIDEFQDTNQIQMNIAKHLAFVHENIFVVGDDDQSIYGWRGAEIKNILEFNKHFKDVKVYKLQQNYRSTKRILELANTIIKKNKVRSSKTLWTENPDGVKVEYYCGDEETNEAYYAVRQIRALVDRGAKYSDFAILMRVNALSRSFEQEFLKYNVPYKVFGGFKFFERKEIKDLTAYLRIINNPLDNDAILRIINTPKRGIGDKTITELVGYASANNLSVFDALCENQLLNLSAGAKLKLESFKRLLFQLAMLKDGYTLDKLIDAVVNMTDFNSQFALETEENISRKLNVEEFKSSVQEYCKLNKEATLEDYLGSIALYSDIDEADSSDYVTIATIHAVKGLEFNTVFVVGLEETIFPISRAVDSPADLEEERRLMYVAITRAEKRLYFTRSNSRYLYGNRQFTMRSRFVTELSEKLGIEQSDRKTAERLGYREDGYGSYNKKSSYVAYEKDDASYGYYPDEANTLQSSGMGNYAKTFSRSGGVKNPSFGKNNATSSKSSANYTVGRMVKHKKFGIGKIKEIIQSGNNLVIAVDFVGLGVKNLAADYAPIELL